MTTDIIYNLYFKTTQMILGEKSWNLSSVFLMYFSNLTEIWYFFDHKEERKLEHSIIRKQKEERVVLRQLELLQTY